MPRRPQGAGTRWRAASRPNRPNGSAGWPRPRRPDWAPQRGLAAYAGLDGRLEIQSFSGGSIDGSAEPQPVDTVFGKGRIGAAAVFDGTKYADLGKLGDSDYLDPISVSAWISPESSADGAIVSSMGENPIGPGWGLFVRGGKLWWHMSRRWSDLSLRIETKRDIVAGRWQHVLLTYDGNRKGKGVRMYLDGEDQDLHVLFDNLDWPSRSNATLKIGGGGGLDNRFAGRIDEVRIYGRELSPAEARSLASVRGLAALAAIPGAQRTPPQRDKLRQAFLDSGASREVRKALYAAREAQRRVEEFRSEIPTVMVMKEGVDRKAYILDRGRYDARGEVVSPGVPEAIRNGLTTGVSDRLALAHWIVSRSNPLTARVIVNRFWQMLFGVGLVKTVDDFGSQGEAPSNQALLDWLAVEFMESGWDVKQLLKTIMSSSTYRQSSRATPALREGDPENRLLARGPRFRLPAATIRDQALAASGMLAGALGGPSVKPYQPPGLWKEVSGQVYEPGSGPDLYRRSLYTYWKRTVAPPSMMNFDASDREVCTVHVKRTNTPLQALNTMNDPTFVEAARNLAESVLRGQPLGREERIEATYRSVLSRPPRPAESDALEALLQSYLNEFSADPEAAEQLLEVGDSPWDRGLDPRELAAYTGIASLVLNLDEAVTKQ